MAQDTEQGLFLTGGFLDLKPAKSFTTRDGEKVEPAKLTLLVGRVVRSIEYRSIADGVAAVGGALPDKMAVVTVPVYASGQWDKASGRRLPVFLQGRLEPVAVEA